MTDSTARQALLQTLRAMPAQLRTASATYVPHSTEWSASAVWGHLCRVEEEVWQARLRQMAASDNPQWVWWDPSGFDWEGAFGAQAPAQLAAQFEARRSATLAHLEGLTESGWQRRGTHAVFGVLDVAGLCREIIAHDEEHRAQLSGEGRIGGNA